MTPFDPPEKVSIRWGQPWQKFTDMSPNLLRQKYWDQYNTITIPLQSHACFFEDAVALAHQCGNEADLLEKELDALRARRVQEFLDVLGSLNKSPPKTVPSEDDVDAHRLSQSASLDDLLQFILRKLYPGNSETLASSPEDGPREHVKEECDAQAAQFPALFEEGEYEEIDDFWLIGENDLRVVGCEDVFTENITGKCETTLSFESSPEVSHVHSSPQGTCSSSPSTVQCCHTANGDFDAANNNEIRTKSTEKCSRALGHTSLTTSDGYSRAETPPSATTALKHTSSSRLRKRLRGEDCSGDQRCDGSPLKKRIKCDASDGSTGT